MAMIKWALLYIISPHFVVVEDGHYSEPLGRGREGRRVYSAAETRALMEEVKALSDDAWGAAHAAA